MIEAIASSINSSNLKQKESFSKMNESKTQAKTNYYVNSLAKLIPQTAMTLELHDES